MSGIEVQRSEARGRRGQLNRTLQTAAAAAAPAGWRPGVVVIHWPNDYTLQDEPLPGHLRRGHEKLVDAILSMPRHRAAVLHVCGGEPP